MRPLPKVEIIAIGSELLTPFYQDTNSLFLTQKLNDIGWRVHVKTITGDDLDELKAVLKIAWTRSDFIITIGGLGPTEDDRTRNAVAETLHKSLILRNDVLDAIRKRFRERGLSMPDNNRKQAYAIEGSDILENPRGTAPGLWIKETGKDFLLLPGPPRELFPMWIERVQPKLEERRKGYLLHRVLKITGLTESRTESMISHLHPSHSPVQMTILASPGQIELHLTSSSQSSQDCAESQLKKLQFELEKVLQQKIFSIDGSELEQTVGNLLLERHATVAVAESCTGGFLGHRITNVSGSSKYFLGGIMVYSDQEKIRTLKIPAELIEKKGSVSAEVAELLAVNVRQATGSDFGLAISGIAGPGGATKEKPVGLVFTSLAWRGGSRVEKNHFFGERDIVKFQATQKTLDMLRLKLLT